VEKQIQSTEQLEFVFFCIDSVAQQLGVEPERLYKMLTEESNLLYGYILPCYHILHTQSKEYIVAEIIDVLRERGVNL